MFYTIFVLMAAWLCLSIILGLAIGPMMADRSAGQGDGLDETGTLGMLPAAPAGDRPVRLVRQAAQPYEAEPALRHRS